MPQILFFIAAILMLIDAVGYSFGAFNQLHQELAPDDVYLSKRLRLNLMLANAELYFTSLFTFIGAYLSGISEYASHFIMGLALLVCLYSVVTVLSLTPSDWKHSIPRLLAAVFITFGLALSHF